MFNAWKLEKATTALVDEAQALSHKLENAKPHVVDSHAATARFWAVSYLSEGQNLHELKTWAPAKVTKFANSLQTKIAALRKKREYDSSDGLAIWLHTARAVTEPRIKPAVREIWQHIIAAGPNADAMADDILQDAGLPSGQSHRIPTGFGDPD